MSISYVREDLLIYFPCYFRAMSISKRRDERSIFSMQKIFSVSDNSVSNNFISDNP